MAIKNKNLYLYLALVCFVGIILVFVFDGYMGIYDSLVIQTGEYEQEIEDTNWDRDYWSTMVTLGEKAFFSYEVDNRRFSGYKADIEVSVWKNQEKINDILQETVSIDSFDKAQIEWTIDSVEIISESAYIEPIPEYTLLIERGEIERKFIIHIRAEEDTIKAIPVPAPPR